jgi:5-methylcytosine-specific restriction endonuclease McrA
MKTCTKCGETKPLDAFALNRRNKTDGRHARCKSCSAEYYAANRERNAESRREYARQYYQANRAKVDAYRAVNREKLNDYQREYRAANIDVYRERQSARQQQRNANNAKRRALANNAAHDSYSRTEIFAVYGGTCAYCGAIAEHLDHVVALSRGGADAAHNLLPACAPCNLSKGAKSLAEWVLSWP